MEPTIDPATAVQAAGRIHRLGQSREVHIVQLAYRNSLDVAILAVHDRVRDGSLTLRDGSFPPELVDVFRAHGVGQSHAYQLKDNDREVQEMARDVRSGRYPALTERDIPPARTWDQCRCCGHIANRKEWTKLPGTKKAYMKPVAAFAIRTDRNVVYAGDDEDEDDDSDDEW